MNRQQRRAAEARRKMENNAARMRQATEVRTELVEAQATAIANLEGFRLILFAAARNAGRMLVRKEDIDALGERDSLEFVTRDNGDVVVEFKAGV